MARRYGISGDELRELTIPQLRMYAGNDEEKEPEGERMLNAAHLDEYLTEHGV